MYNHLNRDCTFYIVTVLDALGKLPSGLLMGHLYWVGAYEECMAVRADYNYTDNLHNSSDLFVEPRHFSGRYCRVDLQPEWVSGRVVVLYG